MADLKVGASASAASSHHQPHSTPDLLIFRLQLDDLCTLPNCSSDLAHNYSMAEGSLPSDHTHLPVNPEAIGLRKMHEITIESYYSSQKDDGKESSLQTEKIPFFSGIPSVEVTKGILHLYKVRGVQEPCSELLCALAVPAHQHLSDMLHFLSPVLSTITSLRVLRDSTPNQYMLLLLFKDKESATQFYLKFNWKPFNSIESALCRLVFVERVEITKGSQEATLPAPGGREVVELPSCPVCLERLDDSVLTVLCNHSFHTQCLNRWEDSTCPICRYTQTPEPCMEDNTCKACDSKEDLWMCLICGHIGCGRYVRGHANMHFLETQHTFSMQLGKTQRVWDYIGDNYVHRLVQNKGDGKLVEVMAGHGLPSEEKIDSLQLEYSYLLSSQLESQRLYFEEKMAHIEKDLTEQLHIVESRCRTAVSEKEQLETKVVELEKEKKSSEKKTASQLSKISKLTAELKEEKEMNKCLSSNQKLWRDRAEAADTSKDMTIQQKESEIKDLKEQVRDLMFFLETQKTVEASPEDTRQELQQGHVVLPTPPPTSATPSRKHKKKK